MNKGDWVCLGSLVAAHGIRGEVRVRCHGQGPASLTGFRQLTLAERTGTLRPVTVLRGRVQRDCAVLSLEGIVERTAAEGLVGCDVLVPRAELPPPAEDEYYWHDLMGLQVLTEEGQDLGRVAAMHATGAHDLLAVQGGGRQYLIPYHEAFVVRQEEGRIVVRLPPGLLEIND